MSTPTITSAITADTEDAYRVWVGCLACYNEGRLVGDWFDADDCPDDQESFNESVKVPRSHTAAGPDGHEEFWVFDHENSPVGGEYSPMAAQEYAEWIKDLDAHERPAFQAYMSNGYDFDSESVENFHEAYQGEYDSDADFAANFADDIGAIPEGLSWPLNCIDWEYAARELMYDYFSENGYYFRSM